ncbi:MAG: serine/threonine protein kinase [Alphaproteobacteria bacterium]|nr:serine/threonine protein kinase [Alphaproteobacteria bacterium]
MQGIRYELLTLLGKGGFGEVWRARMYGEEGFTREVAIKLLLREADEDAARRLRDEARLLGLLSHPTVVQVLGLTRLEGRQAVVMELVEGAPLHLWTSYGRAVPAGPALEIVATVAEALDAAWSTPGPDGRPLRVLHRDIKPSNLQLTRHGALKVLDFGIAQARFDARETQTSDNDAHGTVTYMAPERFNGQGGPEADVYALGVVLCEMLTGKRHGRAPVFPMDYEPFLRERLEGLPGEPAGLGALLEGMLAHAPEARPSAAELRHAARALRLEVGGPSLAEWAAPQVARFLEDMQALDRPQSPPRSALRTWTTTSRRVATRAAVVAVLISLSAGLALASAMGALPGFSPGSGSTLDAASGGQEVRTAPRRRAVVEPKVAAPEASPEEPAAPEPVAASPAPAPAPTAPTAPAGTFVTLTGDLNKVVLVGEAGRFSVPGRVPPGRYLVEADFHRWGLRAQDVVEVGGQAMALRCVDGFGACRPE